MSIYIGTGNDSVQLVSSSVSKTQIKNIIVNEYLPKIGQIKYLARIHPLAVDIQSENFDGWVYADGASYAKSDFSNAYEVFKNRFGGDESYFNVPNLNGFVKPSQSNAELSSVQSYACTPSHYHHTSTDIKCESDHIILSAFTVCPTTHTTGHYAGKKSSSLKQLKNITKNNYKNYINCSEGYTNYVVGFHGAGQSKDPNDHMVMADLNIPAHISFETVECGQTGDDHISAYPAHELLQVMVYIGRRDV